MGDEYPEAEVQGIDLSPIQPGWIPQNVRFLVDDAEAAWTYPANSLDYVHIRHMTSSIRDWPKLISQAYEYVVLSLAFLTVALSPSNSALRGEELRTKTNTRELQGLETRRLD